MPGVLQKYLDECGEQIEMIQEQSRIEEEDLDGMNSSLVNTQAQERGASGVVTLKI